jgi:cytochrome c-type biogenesis protein
MDINLIFSAFVAGVLTFLAPCTLPLVPAYLCFISGVSASELKQVGTEKNIRRRIFINGLLYTLGFSFVFILLGLLFGLGGIYLVHYRIILGRLGGILIIIFGLYMLSTQFLWFDNFFNKLWWFNKEKRLPILSYLKPGHPLSSLFFGAVFAFGWTPCVGPILGTVLLLASQSATMLSGAILLTIFSAGLAIPFLFMAAGWGQSFYKWQYKTSFFKVVAIISGIFLLFIGLLLLFDALSTWTNFFYHIFSFIKYESLLNYL